MQTIKRVLALFLATVTAMTALVGTGATVLAETEGIYTFKTEDGQAVITGCDPSVSGEIEIPDTLGGCPVAAIENAAFLNCVHVTAVSLGGNITEIGSYAFSGCTALAAIQIPDRVVSIGNHAFSNTAYENNEENWQDNVLYIGNHLIQAKSNTLSGAYTIKPGTKTIADNAFFSCFGLTEISFPDSLRTIGGQHL